MSRLPMDLHLDRTTAQPGKRGRIVLVGAGPGARDLLTLRAVQRLQEADVVFFDRLVEDDVLDLARPEAERVFVGKHVGAHSWPQERINAVIVAAALAGRNVVRLKSGDPGIFGRATEELDAARAHGIDVEIVPGVTAACAAAAAMGQSLTERGRSDTLVLATGTGSAENPLPDCVRHAAPGTTTVFYMSVRQARRITDALLQKGLPADAEIGIAAEVAKPGQWLDRCHLADLPEALARNHVKGCAVILATWPAGTPEGTATTPGRAEAGATTGARHTVGA